MIIGFGVGYMFATNTQQEQTPEVALHQPEMMGSDEHPTLEVDTDLPIPSVMVEALPEEKSGYNLRLSVENFRWAPEAVNEEPVQGEGHAHLFVNGRKVARLYGEWFHLSASELQEGENEIEVTLNANDHSEWVLDGEHVSGFATVVR